MPSLLRRQGKLNLGCTGWDSAWMQMIYREFSHVGVLNKKQKTLFNHYSCLMLILKREKT